MEMEKDGDEMEIMQRGGVCVEVGEVCNERKVCRFRHAFLCLYMAASTPALRQC